MAREIPESEVATMEALVKCGVVMVSIALAYARYLEGADLVSFNDVAAARFGRVKEQSVSWH